MLKTEAIKEFLTNYAQSGLLSELYNPNMEVQVNVSPVGGEKVVSNFQGRKIVSYTDLSSGERWKSFRIPIQADSEPQYNDTDITFSMSKRVEAIGMTGWDWVNRQSIYFGYDFDSIANHKAGLSIEQLNQVRLKLNDIPWVTIIKSTSGKGLHIYVTLNSPLPTLNHNEHAAAARSILDLLSALCGQALESSVDTCGQVLWVWHRKQVGTDGYSLLKKGCKLTTIPTNWKEHIVVTSRKKKKITTISQDLDDLLAAMRNNPLTTRHQELIKYLNSHATLDWWWDSDHNMLVCHTLDLAKAHVALCAKGIFSTSSSGSSTQNCFCFPNTTGGWTIRRHGKGVKESSTWVTDEVGWTKCTFDEQIELEVAANTANGIRDSKGCYVFITGQDLLTALNALNIKLEIPEYLLDRRECRLKEKDDTYILNIAIRHGDPVPKGWLLNEKKGCIEIVLKRPFVRREFSPPDNLIRHVISGGMESAWFIYTKSQWTSQNKGNVINVLTATTEYSRGEIDQLLGKCILSPWELVNYPFADEYPGNRMWNKDAAKLAISNEELTQASGDYPNWRIVLDHCGKGLDDSVANSSWCKENNITTGGEYLQLWLACMLKEPNEPLPYLFFFGDQNTGKSTLHEALGQFILAKGYARADQSLVNESGFNSEIANAVLCVVEETDLKQNKEAANRIKDWVTGKTISINTKFAPVIDKANTTHWIQCANDATYCPVLPGDTRVMVIRVEAIRNEIAKGQLFALLHKEAAAFLKATLEISIPETYSRLRIPCLKTYDKEEMEITHQNEVEQFFRTQCTEVAGAKIEFNEWFNQFLLWLPGERRAEWSVNKASRQVPKYGILCKGRLGAKNQVFLGNIMLNSEIELTGKPEYLIRYRVNSATGRLEEENNG